MGKLTDKVAKGVFWVLLEKSGVQAVHFVVTLVLARLLTPNDYGTVALLSIFISLSNLLVDCGFGKALLQKKNATQTDFNSVFYLSMAIAAGLYAILFFASPLVARFYGVPELKIMLRILALSLIFHSINGVQNVELNRKMLFKLSFRVSWVRVIVSAVVGISFAFAGYGAWALVYSSLAGGIAGVIARQLVIRWRPTLTFSWDSVRELFGFGWKMVAASFLTRAYNELYGLLIGKFYARSDLAFVKKGSHIPKMLGSTADTTLARVAFSALVRLQDDPDRLRNAMRRLISCSSFVVFPLMTCCALVADPLISLLYGDKWLPAVPYVQVTCFVMLFRPFDTINLQAISACGRSDIYLKLIFFRRLVGLVVMAAALPKGVLVFMISSAIVLGPFGVVVNSLPNLKMLKYSILMQVRDVMPSLMLSVAMAAVILGVGMLPVRPRVLLFPQVVLGFAAYAALAVAFRLRPLAELSGMLLPRVAKLSPGLARPLEWVRGRCSE